ncbi:MAG: hypothetical protein H6737_12835 [Alphaproteobacteria bacterium]|nr:hypothetical protein [Alphaproteobacteria bacterium]
MTLKGTLKYVDLGPGQWVLETRKGKVSLFGDIDTALDGREVEVEGDAVDGMSASMVGGSAVSVRSVRAKG